MHRESGDERNLHSVTAIKLFPTNEIGEDEAIIRAHYRARTGDELRFVVLGIGLITDIEAIDGQDSTARTAVTNIMRGIQTAIIHPKFVLVGYRGQMTVAMMDLLAREGYRPHRYVIQTQEQPVFIDEKGEETQL